MVTKFMLCHDSECPVRPNIGGMVASVGRACAAPAGDTRQLLSLRYKSGNILAAMPSGAIRSPSVT